jgi:PhzF family phenazine biosynthesis protein
MARVSTLTILEYAAFTVDAAGGNPAGVVLDARGAADGRLQEVAAQVGHSETAFVVDRADRHLRVRYFSPMAEVAFCGHATIATAVALAEREGAGPYELATNAGLVTVDVVDAPGGLLATLTSVPTRTRAVAGDVLARALTALRWTADDLDPAYPVHVSHGGVDHLVVGLHDRATLAGLDYDFDALARLMSEQGWTTVHAFCAESRSLFHARNAFPPGGVVEDPATGAAAAAFGGYLRDLGHLDPGETVTVLQGYDHGTPSRLLVQPEAGTGRRVRVTGTATPLGRSA